MGNLSQLVEELRSENLQGLESLESMGNLELNNYLKQVGLGNLAPKEARAIIQSMKPNASSMTMVNSFRAPVSAAIFDLTITRNTANIVAPLPVPIFGALDRESNYVEIISQDLPVGTILSNITKSPTGKGIRFEYTAAGPLVDTIDVECAQVPYLNILRSSQGSLLKFSQCKMQISDVTIQSQFARKVGVVVNTIFGKNTSDSFTPNQFKSDLQNQNDIRTISAVQDIDMETSMVFLMNATVAFSVTYTAYVEKFEVSRAKGF